MVAGTPGAAAHREGGKGVRLCQRIFAQSSLPTLLRMENSATLTLSPQ